LVSSKDLHQCAKDFFDHHSLLEALEIKIMNFKTNGEKWLLDSFGFRKVIVFDVGANLSRLSKMPI